MQHASEKPGPNEVAANSAGSLWRMRHLWSVSLHCPCYFDNLRPWPYPKLYPLGLLPRIAMICLTCDVRKLIWWGLGSSISRGFLGSAYSPSRMRV
jgi:hypothetical protein